MELDKVVEYIEDRPIKTSNKWFLHATFNDINIIESILKNGIQCARLSGVGGNGWNGPYYISLFQNDNDYDSSILRERFETNIKLIVTGIRPHHMIDKKFAAFFAGSRIPIRTSGYRGEYQEYLRIDPSKFVGIDYSLSRVMCRGNIPQKESTLYFLKDVTNCVQGIIPRLPIYDLDSSSEINKTKVIDLKI